MLVCVCVWQPRLLIPLLGKAVETPARRAVLLSLNQISVPQLSRCQRGCADGRSAWAA